MSQVTYFMMISTATSVTSVFRMCFQYWRMPKAFFLNYRVQISIILNEISTSEQNQSHSCHYQIIFSDNPRSGQPRQLFIVICVELMAFESLVKAHRAAQTPEVISVPSHYTISQQ